MDPTESVKVSKEDDGDFDRLRRKIIQKLKSNEELRENIISIVKQSAALNREGAVILKPRQLFDDIYHEVRVGEICVSCFECDTESVMSRISDGLWGIIRSTDEMHSEITQTVSSVYDKLANPGSNVEGGTSRCIGDVHVECIDGDNGSVVGDVNGSVGGVLDNHEGENINHEVQLRPQEIEQQGVLEDKMETENVGSREVDIKEGCDEDPDLPPGFV